MELLFWCQQKVVYNLMDHPAETAPSLFTSMNWKVAMILPSSSSACLLCCFKKLSSADVGLWRLTGFGTRGDPLAVKIDANANKITKSISSSRWEICQTRRIVVELQTEFLALKHESRILRHSSNPVCGFSLMEQVRLCAVWPMENWLGSSLNQIQGWTLSENRTLVL